jgi:uncharacterized protein
MMGAQQITRKDILQQVIRSSQVCSIAMVDENHLPYVLPFNFGTDDKYIWFHSALTGKKIDILRHNPSVCVIFSTDYELGHRHDHVACSYFMKYKSVMVNGEIEFIDDPELKKYGMNIIMKQYTGKDDFSYNKPAIDNVCIYRLKIENITGRSYGY